jgi:hypothetical protein
LNEEHGLRVLENRVLRRIFLLQTDEIRGWIILHNEELRNLYTWPDIIRMSKSKWVRLEGKVACMKNINSCRFLVGKPEGSIHC